LTETKKEIPLTDPIFTKLKHKQQIQVLKGDSAFKYTYGSSNTRDKIYPYYEEARDKGFGDALVVAFKNDIAISGNDSTYTLKIPINIEGDKVTIFSGKVRDSQGNPIMAVLTVEDLMNNVEVIRVKTGESGAFSLKLPDGRIYGYYLDSEGYFPYSDYLDLRSSGQTVKKEVVIEETLTMQSIKEIMSKGSTVRMNNIFFDYDKADLKPESNFELTLIVGMLKDHPEIRLEILGHTDSEGEASYNHELSKYRAEAVASYLKKAGYADRVIRTIGYGELLPIADNETPTGRQLNRRVELRLMKK
jgi:OOP family OmpA-OmpF porin